MKNIYKLTFLSIIILVVTTISCKKEDEKIPEQLLKVAMLAQGFTYDDLSFLQNCKAGIELAKTDFNLEVEYNIDTATDNYQLRIDAFGDQDFDLIIAIGFMWNDAVIAAAKKYPASKFVLVDTELSELQANAVSILFDVDEASYSLGFLSAWWADNHDAVNPAIAYVGALEIPQIRQFIEPWINGLDRYNQKYGRTVAHYGDYAGDFFNPDLGKHIADSLITLGADVIFGVGSETGNGSLLKAKELGKVGIGVDVDQYISFPEVSDILLSCAMKGLDNAIYAVVKSYVDNTFPGGGVYTGKLSNDGVGLAPYHNYESQIPDSIKIEIEAIKAGIIDGSISTGW
ncbi:MAG: BMP family ABC transporter substrate-binding protein [Bacteroidales bacterium]|nr:BMP family ABC transporter substrate-binding protein [Bacteroidales bacterium]